MTHAGAPLRVARIDGTLDFDPERLATFLSREFGDVGKMDVSRVGGGHGLKLGRPSDRAARPGKRL
jgi:hypothetical protein